MEVEERSRLRWRGNRPTVRGGRDENQVTPGGNDTPINDMKKRGYKPWEKKQGNGRSRITALVLAFWPPGPSREKTMPPPPQREKKNRMRPEAEGVGTRHQGEEKPLYQYTFGKGPGPIPRSLKTQKAPNSMRIPSERKREKKGKN